MNTSLLGRAARRALTLASLTAGLLVAPSAASAAPVALPPQGMYDQCSPAAAMSDCIGRLDTFASAGFKLVLNYTVWDASPEQIVAYADAAQARGMRVIWPLNNAVWRQNGDISRVYPKLARACGCTQAAVLLPFVMGLVSRHAGTWGWYVGDEVAAVEAPLVAALTARVKLIDPATRTLYIAYENTGTKGANLQPFASAADVVGTDSYPFGTGAAAVPQVQFVSDLTRDITKASGRSTAMVLQAFDWGNHQDEYPGAHGFPDRAFMAAARDAALQASPELILWYSYPEILKSDDPAGHWRDLVAAALTPPAPTPAAAQAPAAAAPIAGTVAAPQGASSQPCRGPPCTCRCRKACGGPPCARRCRKACGRPPCTSGCRKACGRPPSRGEIGAEGPRPRPQGVALAPVRRQAHLP